MDMIIYYLEQNMFFFLSSSVFVGIIGHIIVEKISSKRNPCLHDNTISEEHIENCICFKPDTDRSIDDVVSNLETNNVDVNYFNCF